MKVRLVHRAIEIDGEGAGVPIAEIHRVVGLFRELFGEEPRIRMTGVFRGDAIGPVAPGGDPRADAWDLRQDSVGGYAPVVHVGPELVHVQFQTGVNRGRSAALSPDRGTLVSVRLSLADD